MAIPRATYRLQLRPGFGFREAAELAPYLSLLGVSHVYNSPIFKARPGSTHGYDITDHDALNPELGSDADYAAMIAAFRREGLGCIQDFVPNHMGVGGADNPLWLDVLEWGPHSRYAAWFDIDWSAGHGARSANKLLTPVLGEQYGAELRAGKLVLVFDAEEGAFAIWAYGEHKLPVCPVTYVRILGHRNERLDRLADLFLDLPHWRPQVVERAQALKRDLAKLIREDAKARAELDARIAALNADWRALDALIAAQFWRVASHRVASDEINYRRFFDINDLAGLRMELTPVFEGTHRRLVSMVERGELDGVRLDHIDGLFDPKQYLQALRAAVNQPLYLVVEKILAPHERLREDWPVEGTTGYDSLNIILGALIDQSAEESFTETYCAFSGQIRSFTDIARDCKIRILDNEMASELNALSRAAARLAEQSPMTVDFTHGILHRALRQMIANFPVYRTYVDLDSPDEDLDRRSLDWAISRARADADIHPSAFDFLRAMFLPDHPGPQESEVSPTAGLRFAMKVQQASGPIMAKGVEDTAFYRFNRFLALNEVGGAPDRFGLPLPAFHETNAYAAENWPHTMIATSTHDTKRGEDARARLAALADLPDEWRRMVLGWTRVLRASQGDARSDAPPDREDEYMLYQMLVGSWPNELLDPLDLDGLQDFSSRLEAALEKSLREGKQRSGWAAPNVAYEDAVRAFVRSALDPDGGAFLASFLPFVRRVAALGVQNSLAQLAMKMTLPGLPDIYQGCELWNLSMVDPDGRRPVDFSGLREMIGELEPRLASVAERPALVRELLDDWKDGRIKLVLTILLLRIRREREAFFREARYEPVTIRGDQAQCALGYVRSKGDDRIVVLVARFPGRREALPAWSASALIPEGEWTDLIFGTRVRSNGEVTLPDLLSPLPFALLERA